MALQGSDPSGQTSQRTQRASIKALKSNNTISNNQTPTPDHHHSSPPTPQRPPKMAAHTSTTKQTKPILTITTHPNIPALGAPTILGLGEPYVSSAAAKWEREHGCNAIYRPAIPFAQYASCGANVDAHGIPRTFWEPVEKKQPPVGTKAQDPEAKGEGKGGKKTIPFPKYDEAVAFREAISQQFPWLLPCACSPCCKRS